MHLLQTRTVLFFTIFFISSLVPLSRSLAESTVKCHCFKDRTFNPADTFAADDYILATSFNSLLAKAFAIAKQELVLLKMKQGVGQDDLMIGLQVAGAAGVDFQELLSRRRDQQTWAEIVAGLEQDGRISQGRFAGEIRAGMPLAESGARVAETVIADFYKVPLELVREFRAAGLNEQELALLFVLAHAGEQDPGALVDLHNRQGQSWGAIAHRYNIDPAGAGKLILQYPARQVSD